MANVRTSALRHLDKRENLLREDASESVTVVTPLAQRQPPGRGVHELDAGGSS